MDVCLLYPYAIAVMMLIEKKGKAGWSLCWIKIWPDLGDSRTQPLSVTLNHSLINCDLLHSRDSLKHTHMHHKEESSTANRQTDADWGKRIERRSRLGGMISRGSLLVVNFGEMGSCCVWGLVTALCGPAACCEAAQPWAPRTHVTHSRIWLGRRWCYCPTGREEGRQ